MFGRKRAHHSGVNDASEQRKIFHLLAKNNTFSDLARKHAYELFCTVRNLHQVLHTRLASRDTIPSLLE